LWLTWLKAFWSRCMNPRVELLLLWTCMLPAKSIAEALELYVHKTF
jgi:hypothetical protein